MYNLYVGYFLKYENIKGGKLMSRWLEQELKEWNEFRAKKRNSQKFLIIFFIAVIGYFTYLLLQKGTDSEEFSQGFPVVCMIAAVFLFVFIVAIKVNNKVGNPYLEKTVARICTTQDEAEQFDSEITNEPNIRINAGKLCGDILFTDHYIFQMEGKVPLRSYSISKFDEIKNINYCWIKDHSTTFELGRQYLIDLLDENNNKIGNINAKGSEARDNFFDAIQNIIPEITINEV